MLEQFVKAEWDIPRYCNLQIGHMHVIYGSDVHTSPTAKHNEGLLNQDHKFWNKSFARSRVPFRKTSCLAQRWRSLQLPGLWQEQCDSSSPVSGWGPSNSNKIELFCRKRRTSCKKNKSRTSQPILTYWNNYMISIPSSSNTTSALQRMPMMIVQMHQHAP